MPKHATVYITETLRHAVHVEIDPDWLDENGDLTTEGEDMLRATALEDRGDATVQACIDVEVLEVELN
jgi:hypothetical protein